MFNRILIANRGEIACRVIDTCRRMGVATVAVFSEADRSARHVAMADQSVCIGGLQPAESYLRGDAILAAAQATGAAAVHPGYGFLSENAGFAEDVGAAGLTFIGPSPAAIRAMGLKDAAKARMTAAGVPVVPGYPGTDQSDNVLATEAARIGYPVLIKAVAGGGGRGMRLVETPDAFAGALASARREAAAAFGNDRVLLERCIARPRHIEVQVFGDGTQAVHLFERDCSLQRRHQKVIEESPAPGMTAEMRAAMGEAAVTAARAIGYSGAGTVEFIADASDGLRADRFWFLEMNTRLQVEHPVTEAVTGIDLVEWQLRVASGEALPLQQQDIRLTGHAIEARLYAEDVAAGFLPTTGRLAHLAFPDGVRVETGVRSSDLVSPWYDPLLAKLIVQGPTRAAALARLQVALGQVEVAGVTTNLGFLGALARHPDVGAGHVDTGLIARALPGLASRPAPTPGHLALAAIAALDLQREPDWARGFALWQPLTWTTTLVWEAGPIVARVTVVAPGRVCVAVRGAEVQVDWQGCAWKVAGSAPTLSAHRFGDLVHLFDSSGAIGQGFAFGRPDPLDRTAVAPVTSNAILSPMPGMVRSVLVGPGDRVEPGDRLVLVEAMKMEHALLAPRMARVAEVRVVVGSQVVAGEVLIVLDPADLSPADLSNVAPG